MSSIPGTVVAAKVVPGDTGSTYATHEDIYGKGGYVVVADKASRNAIIAARLKTGMMVVLQTDLSAWVLGPSYSVPTIDADWQAAQSPAIATFGDAFPLDGEAIGFEKGDLTLQPGKIDDDGFIKVVDKATLADGFDTTIAPPSYSSKIGALDPSGLVKPILLDVDGYVQVRPKSDNYVGSSSSLWANQIGIVDNTGKVSNAYGDANLNLKVNIFDDANNSVTGLNGVGTPISSVQVGGFKASSGTIQSVQIDLSDNLKVIEENIAQAENALGGNVPPSAICIGKKDLTGDPLHDFQPFIGDEFGNLNVNIATVTGGSISVSGAVTEASLDASITTNGGAAPANLLSVGAYNSNTSTVVPLQSNGTDLWTTNPSIGTISNTGVLNPGSASLSGFVDYTGGTVETSLLRPATVYDLRAGGDGGPQWNLGVSLRKSFSGGSVEFGTDTNPIFVDVPSTSSPNVTNTDNSGQVSIISGSTPTKFPVSSSWADASALSQTTLVTNDGGMVIRCFAWTASAKATATPFKFYSWDGAGTFPTGYTAISCQYNAGIYGGAVANYNVHGWFDTIVDQNLVIDVGAGDTLGVQFTITQFLP